MPDVICPQCRVVNRDSARYCTECGTPLLAGPSDAEQAAASSPATQILGQSPSPIQSERLMNRYRLDKELGRGGFGAVYKGWDENVNRPCAIKENLEVSVEAQRQFAREASVLANLSHPNLPRVTDHFTIAGKGQYLVMDYVEGEDLATILEQQKVIAVPTAVGWVLQVAEALDYLHEQTPPVLHRDIKPANIRITPRGKAMLVDFGLVKLYEASAHTTVGARAVTPGYAPPEQYGRGHTDARSDIYALAATLYNIVTGEQPQESVLRVSSNSHPTATQRNPNVSPALSMVISQGMSLDPAQRFQTANEFCRALQNVFYTANDEATAYGMPSPFTGGGGSGHNTPSRPRPGSGPVSGERPPSGPPNLGVNAGLNAPSRPRPGSGPVSGQRPPSGPPNLGVNAGLNAPSQPRPGSGLVGASRGPSAPINAGAAAAGRSTLQAPTRRWLIPAVLGGVILLCLVGVISAGGLFGLSLLPVDTTATSQMQITLGAQIQSTAAAQSTQVSAQNTRTASGVLNPPPALPNRPAGLPTWPQVNTRAYDEPQSGWESGQDTTSKFFNTIEAVIQTDQLIYQLEPKTADVYWFTSNKRLTAGENFIFSASLKQASGANDSWQGLIFRQKDAQNFYLFGVSDAGQFGVWRYLGGKWEAVEQPTSIAAVQAGATHNLLVYAQGQMFKMYIENEKVAEAVLQDFSEGFIGFYFEFKTPTAAKFEITNVILQAP